MSSRYDDDRDYDRDSQYYGQYNRRSNLDYGNSFSDRNDRSFGDRPFGESSQSRYGSSGGGYSGRGRESGGRESERYGREGTYGSSGYGYGYSGRERDSERYGREGSGRYSSGRGRDYESGRQNYWGEGWENERDNDTSESRYGSYRGVSGRQRGYGEGSSGYGQGSRSYTDRMNYPSGYRSGQSYNPSSRSYDHDRGYDRGEDRGWWDRASDEVASWFGDEEAERRRRMDAQQQHRGRGPKNYRRSDERIKEDVNDRLSDDNYLDASEIEVMVTNAEVTLTGTVHNRNDKRRAEDLAESVSGVANVENRLRVKQSNYGSYTGAGTSSGSSMSATGTGSGSTSMSGTGTTTGTGTGTDISGTPGSTTSSAAAGRKT